MENTTGNSAPDLGGLVIPPDSSQSAGDSSPNSATTASEETIRQRKRRSDAGKPRGARGGELQQSATPISAQQFAALYNPDLWGRTLAAPGDAMAAITGNKRWEISAQERTALGTSGSIAAQCFATSDPKWLAVSIALITVLEVYGIRIAAEMSDRKKAAEEEAKKKKNFGA